MENRNKAGQDAGSVFRWHSGYVRRVLRYFGVAESDVSDTSQEVFVVVHRKLDEFEGRANIRTWLYRICANAASDYRRRAYRRHERPVEALTEPVSNDDPHRTAVLNQRVSQLAEALGSLSEPQRRVFVLYEIQQRSASDIAALEQCPLKTVFSRLYAARRHLLERLGGDDDGRHCLPLLLAPGRWLETPGIEQILLPLKLQPAGGAGIAAGWLGGALTKIPLASVGAAALAACLLALGDPTGEVQTGEPETVEEPAIALATLVSVDLPTDERDRSIIPAETPSDALEPARAAALNFASAETVPVLAGRRDPPPAATRKPIRGSVEEPSIPVALVLEGEGEIDDGLVVVRTGRLDRSLCGLGAMPEERDRTLSDPVDRGYRGLADRTAQELVLPPVTGNDDS